MNSIDFEVNEFYPKGAFIKKGRYCEFTEEVRRNFNKDVDICHGISFFCMSTAIVNAMNYFWYKNRDVEKTLEYIYGIIIAVKRIKYSGTIDLEEIEEYKEYLEKLEIVLNNILENSNHNLKYFHCEHSIYYLNAILDKLYNEEANLHFGNPAWNRSIGGAYDPVEFSIDKGKFLLGEEDSIAITNLLKFTLGYDESYPSENGLFFYKYEMNGNKFLYTSCTKENFVKAKNVSECDIPIRYKDYLENKIKIINVL